MENKYIQLSITAKQLEDMVIDYNNTVETVSRTMDEINHANDTLALLNNGSTFVFGGGDASVEVGLNAVDTELSTSSTNTVQNGVIASRFELLESELDTKSSAADTFEQIYPIGSIFLSSENASPADIFTKTAWELVDTISLSTKIIYLFIRTA